MDQKYFPLIIWGKKCVSHTNDYVSWGWINLVSLGLDEEDVKFRIWFMQLTLLFFILLEVSNYRRGEEHSFILKPATSVCNHLKVLDESPHFSKLQSGSSASKSSLSSNSLDRSKISSIDDQYAVMVSCRCNYTSKPLAPFDLFGYII